jgi:hypothetical protein
LFTIWKRKSGLGRAVCVLLPLQQHHEVVVSNACAWIKIGIEINIKTVWSFRDDEWLNI